MAQRLTSLGVLKDYRVAVVPGEPFPPPLGAPRPPRDLTTDLVSASAAADPNAMSSRDVVVVVVMEEPGWYSGGIGVYTESGKVELVRT